jgi:hypothetical protein
MADLPYLELSADQGYDVVRRHPFGLVHEQYTIRSHGMRHA